MGLKGKMSCQTEVNCHGNIFHELFRHKPHEVSKFATEKVQSCELHEGEYGKVGSVLIWKYKHEGKEKVMKTEIEAVDEEKKIITFKTIEGDVLEHYKKLTFTMHIESRHAHVHHRHGHGGEEKEEEEEHEHLVNWTIEYEKKHEDAPTPTSYLDLALSVTKDIEVHHVIKK